ncbi:signal peptide peptidase SppA [Candidatus Woesearchaeota archaeon]|nr:signal peptide peptidase SppA [Candidatus Woesearchaeota archaeon]
MKKEMQIKKTSWLYVIKTLFMLFILSLLIFFSISLFIEVEPIGNIAEIPIKGVITVEGGSGFGVQATSSEDTVKLIEKASENPSIKGILLNINSPGGSAVASKEIADAIKKVNKTTVAIIREVGASGAYWIASATDQLIANEMSITGSIGVLGSYLQFSGILERYNITYQRLVGGQFKDIGSPYKDLTKTERNILQEKINKIHDVFIKSVAENRNMSFERMKLISTGEFFLGSEAFELNLIDQVGDIETAKEYLKQELNLTTITLAEYKKPTGFAGLFGSTFSEHFFYIGKGIGSELFELRKSNKLEITT